MAGIKKAMFLDNRKGLMALAFMGASFMASQKVAAQQNALPSKPVAENVNTAEAKLSTKLSMMSASTLEHAHLLENKGFHVTDAQFMTDQKGDTVEVITSEIEKNGYHTRVQRYMQGDQIVRQQINMVNQKTGVEELTQVSDASEATPHYYNSVVWNSHNQWGDIFESENKLNHVLDGVAQQPEAVIKFFNQSIDQEARHNMGNPPLVRPTLAMEQIEQMKQQIKQNQKTAHYSSGLGGGPG